MSWLEKKANKENLFINDISVFIVVVNNNNNNNWEEEALGTGVSTRLGARGTHKPAPLAPRGC